MNVILWDGPTWQQMLPFTFTRPAGLIRVGILTIAEKYEQLGAKASFLTQDYLRKKFSANPSASNLVVNAAVLPDKALLESLSKLVKGESYWQNDTFIAGVFTKDEVEKASFDGNQRKPFDQNISLLDRVWKIFSLNEQEIKKDFPLITAGRKSQPVPSGNFVKSPENIFLEDGAVVENSSLNASSGPIYIGKDAEVMEGSLIRGPFALCEHSALKLGAKIYGATTIGPHCKVGGEVNNSVFFGYSNKAHDGFVGNAVIGEWCNLGADSNNSNLKNNYEQVKIWNYATGSFENTGLQFCGLFMGDHSKCGINTMFNTGTVVGVSSNIFGSGFPRNYIPSFSWGGASGMTDYKFEKAMETARLVMARRGLELGQEDLDILEHVYRNEVK